MKILVTGGYGFIGSSYIIAAIKAGHSVFNIDSMEYASNYTNLRAVQRNIAYSEAKLDIAEFDAVQEATLSFKPDMIVHFAAESHVDNSIRSPRQFLSSNVIGTFNLLEAVRIYLEKTTISNFLFHHISTDEVFGSAQPHETFSEESRYDPRSPYSATKASSDHLVRSWANTYDIPYLITNCSNNYGPRQHEEKLIPKVIKCLLTGEKIPIYGNGFQQRDWLFVEDHIAALVKLQNSNFINQTFNIGGQEVMENIKVVNIIFQEMLQMGLINYKNLKDVMETVNDRPGHDLRYAVDTTKISSAIHWAPETQFRDGIVKTINWYANYLRL